MVLGSSSRPSFLSMRNSWTSLRWSPWSWITSPMSESLTMVPLQAGLTSVSALACYIEASCYVPNFFLMTFRIFFWSNFLGRP